jgi:nitroreductase
LREALSLAPSANNKQPCSFAFVRNHDVRAQIVGKACHQEGFLDAPLIVVPCCQRGAEFDCAIALDHLILAATNEGLGSCWVGWIERDAIREILGIPDDIDIPVIVPIGYAAESPGARPRKALSELIQEDAFEQARP